MELTFPLGTECVREMLAIGNKLYHYLFRNALHARYSCSSGTDLSPISALHSHLHEQGYILSASSFTRT